MSTETLQSSITRDEALALLKTYNKDNFHIRHALTVEGVMRWYARALGHADEEEFWGQVGLLHDIDFEMYPQEHCTKAPELLKKGNVNEKMIHAICSHGYGTVLRTDHTFCGCAGNLNHSTPGSDWDGLQL